MRDPKEIKTVVEGATYEVPLFTITDQGAADAGTSVVKFCKGDKSNPETFRQDGHFTETIIALAKKCLEDLNKGNLENAYTSAAITHLDAALFSLGARIKDRTERGVFNTHEK